MVGEVTASAGDEQPLMGGEGNEEKAAAQGCLLAIYWLGHSPNEKILMPPSGQSPRINAHWHRIPCSFFVMSTLGTSVTSSASTPTLVFPSFLSHVPLQNPNPSCSRDLNGSRRRRALVAATCWPSTSSSQRCTAVQAPQQSTPNGKRPGSVGKFGAAVPTWCVLRAAWQLPNGCKLPAWIFKGLDSVDAGLTPHHIPVRARSPRPLRIE